jgi:hypothetical protein
MEDGIPNITNDVQRQAEVRAKVKRGQCGAHKVRQCLKVRKCVAGK